MRKYRLHVQNLLLETDIGDQTILIAADIKHDQLANPIYCIKRRFKCSPVGKPVFFNHPPPSLQGCFGQGVISSECTQGAIADYFHRRILSQIEIVVRSPQPWVLRVGQVSLTAFFFDVTPMRDIQRSLHPCMDFTMQIDELHMYRVVELSVRV